MNSLFRLFLLLCLVMIGFSCSPNPSRVIACVGDSITAGARVENPDTQSYPATLQRLLGVGYEVRNLGISSCTLLKNGRPTVWELLNQIQATQPDVVIISLGTNDTCGEGTCGERKCWEYQAEFVGDYLALIDTLRTFPSRPEIWLCAPSPMVLETPGLSEERMAGLRIRKPRLQELIQRIQRIASEQQLGFIDLNHPLDHRPELFTEQDGVHPNAAGYQEIAELVYAALKP